MNEEQKIDHLTTEEIERLTNRTDQFTPTQNLVLEIGLKIGMLPKEIVDISIGDINRDRNLISIHAGSKARSIVLDDTLMNNILEYIGSRTSGKLFVNPKTGIHLNLNMLNLMIKKAGESADIPNLTAYTLRHTCAHYLLIKGLNNEELCKYFGWKYSTNIHSYDKTANNQLSDGGL